VIRRKAMRKIITLALLILILPAMPAYALSELADDFLLECRQLDRPFPPEDWSDEDIRLASHEVLDYYEDTGEEEWAVYFCIVALGHTRVEGDVSRILDYEDTWTEAVIEALRGFPSPDAIECLLRQSVAERATFREQAYKGLGEIDFDELEEPDEWRETVIEGLLEARELEEYEPLIELIDETIESIELKTSGTEEEE